MPVPSPLSRMPPPIQKSAGTYLPAVETLIRRRFEGALGEANP